MNLAKKKRFSIGETGTTFMPSKIAKLKAAAGSEEFGYMPKRSGACEMVSAKRIDMRGGVVSYN